MTSPRAKTKAEKDHMARVAELGCIICQQPAELHHIREMQGMGSKASNLDVIGLCHRHHRTGGYGIAFHAGRKAFEANFGTQRELLRKTKDKLEGW